MGKLDTRLNSSLIVLKDGLKASRERYVYRLSTTKPRNSKRQRRMAERQDLPNDEDSVGESTNVSEQTAIANDPKSPSHFF